MKETLSMEIQELGPDETSVSLISQEEGGDLEDSPNNNDANIPTETSQRSAATQTSHSDFTSLVEAVHSIQQQILSKFGELNRTLTRHCDHTQQVLHHIRLRIDAYLRPPRSSIQRRTGTRSSRLPNRRPQYHLRSVAQRASTFRTHRRGSHRIGPQRSMTPRITGQMPSVIHRRTVNFRPLQPRNNPGDTDRGNNTREELGNRT